MQYPQLLTSCKHLEVEAVMVMDEGAVISAQANENSSRTRTHSVWINPGTRADCFGLLPWGVLATHNPHVR